MKREFEIKDDELFGEYYMDEGLIKPLKNVIRDKVAMTIARKLYDDNFDNREHWNGMINSEISNVIKEKGLIKIWTQLNF